MAGLSSSAVRTMRSPTQDDIQAESEALKYFFQAPDGDALLAVLGPS